jgi:transcription elongation factor Elf1
MFYVIEYDVNTLTLKLRCKGCEHEFVCDIHNVSNISKTYMSAMVTCPKCGAHEEFSAEKVIEREIVASAITELESMKCTLAEAEKKVGQPCQ